MKGKPSRLGTIEENASRQAVLKQQQNGVSESCFFDVVVVALLTALSKVNGGEYLKRWAACERNSPRICCDRTPRIVCKYPRRTRRNGNKCWASFWRWAWRLVVCSKTRPTRWNPSGNRRRGVYWPPVWPVWSMVSDNIRPILPIRSSRISICIALLLAFVALLPAVPSRCCRTGCMVWWRCCSRAWMTRNRRRRWNWLNWWISSPQLSCSGWTGPTGGSSMCFGLPSPSPWRPPRRRRAIKYKSDMKQINSWTTKISKGKFDGKETFTLCADWEWFPAQSNVLFCFTVKEQRNILLLVGFGLKCTLGMKTGWWMATLFYRLGTRLLSFSYKQVKLKHEPPRNSPWTSAGATPAKCWYVQQ